MFVELRVVTALEDRIHAFPRERTYLLPALHEVQELYGWLPADALESVGSHLRVPRSEVYGIASSFPDFALHEPVHAERTCLGASCRVMGAPNTAEASADCLFICGVGPVSEVDGRLIGRNHHTSEVPTLAPG